MRERIDIDWGSTATRGIATRAPDTPDAVIPFGREMARQFLFADGYRNINHGSFGTYPRPLRRRLQELQDEAEARPDIFIRLTQPRLLNESRHLLAKFLNAPPSTIVLVPNATTGINTVFRNIVFHDGDTILCFSTTYGSLIKTLLSLAETTPVSITSIPLLNLAALSNTSILAAVEKTVLGQREAGLNPRAILIDAIVSQPGIRMPFEAIVKLCRRLGIYSVVDAAHAIGQIPLDLSALDPDFLVTNCHKWLFVPRACAVFYVPKRNQALIRTTMPTSAGFVPHVPPGKIIKPPPAQIVLPSATGSPDDETPFVKLFEYVGTLDNIPYFCIGEALRFRERVCGGEAATQAYCANLARKGADRVAEMLGTDVMDNKEKTLRNGLALVNVRLPLDPKEILQLAGETHDETAEAAVTEAAEIGGGGATVAVVDDQVPKPDPYGRVSTWIQWRLVEEYDTSIPVAWWGGAWWTRLSGQVYLEMEDFEWVAEVFQSLCERVRKGEHLKDA